MLNNDYNLNKSDLILHLARRHPAIDEKKIKECLDTLLEEIIFSVAMGERIEIRGFGVFSKKYIRPRRFINPKTKKESFISETATVHFKASRRLLDSYD